MRTDLKKTGLSLKTIYDKLKKFFYVGLLLIPTLLFLGSPELHGNPGGASASEPRPLELRLVDKDYIKAKLSIDRIFNDDTVATSLGQIRAMKSKELNKFKNFLVYCSSFMDLFLKGSHVLYQCRIAQRHFNFQHNRDREIDWLIDDILKGISHVHDEVGGTRFKEDFIIRKRTIEREWIRTLNQRYLELEGVPDNKSPQT